MSHTSKNVAEQTFSPFHALRHNIDSETAFEILTFNHFSFFLWEFNLDNLRFENVHDATACKNSTDFSVRIGILKSDFLCNICPRADTLVHVAPSAS